MAPGANPSIQEVRFASSGLTYVAFQGRNGDLVVYGATGDTGLPMMANTNPSMIVSPVDEPGNPLGGQALYTGYVSPTGAVSVYGYNEADGTTFNVGTGLVAATGASPSIVSALNWFDGGQVVTDARPAAVPATPGHIAAPATAGHIAVSVTAGHIVVSVTAGQAAVSVTAGQAAVSAMAGQVADQLRLPGLPSKPVVKPMLAQPVIANSCPTVRAHLKQYAARGIKKVACETLTLGAPHALTRTGALSPAGSRAVTPNATGSSLCGVNNAWVISRTEECIQNRTSNWRIFNTQTGAPLGTAQFLLNQDVILQTNTTLPVENDSITFGSATGQGANPATVTYTASCGAPCSVASGGGTTFTAGVGSVQGNIHTVYSDSPGTTVPDTFNNAYALEVIWPGVTPINAVDNWSLPYKIRCDNLFPGNMAAGCVVPAFGPILTLPISVYGAAAVNVYIGENYLPGTPGLSSSTPLTRGDPAKVDANRAAVCNGFKTLAMVANDSCDEYPFASSQQSGGALGLTGINCIEALPFQFATGFWTFTFLTKYTFAPPQLCERGHVPTSQNRAVGTALNSMYTNNRMLIGDAYAVQVVN